MTYSYRRVDRIPKELSEGVVYHDPEFELGALICACGCGQRIDLLVPDSHRITSVNGLATIRPSILVSHAPCKSHFFITRGAVERLPAFSAAEASDVMRRQIARHAAHDVVRPGWAARWARMFAVMFGRRPRHVDHRDLSRHAAKGLCISRKQWILAVSLVVLIVLVVGFVVYWSAPG